MISLQHLSLKPCLFVNFSEHARIARTRKLRIIHQYADYKINTSDTFWHSPKIIPAKCWIFL